MTRNTDYLLGHDDPELRRLEDQGKALGPATDVILKTVGIEPGMRVIDLGTGVGDVALAVADLVGPTGKVVGIDQSEESLGYARRRAAQRGLDNTSFVHGDLHTIDVAGEFDAVVGRLVLVYTPDPAAVVRRYARLLRPGGLMVAIEVDMTAAGMVPMTEFASTILGWVTEAFLRSGHDPMLGVRMTEMFRRAGLDNPTMLGIQPYFEVDSPIGPQMVSSLVRTLLPAIEGMGVATAVEVDVDTLEERIAAHQSEVNAVCKPPTLIGTWARVG